MLRTIATALFLAALTLALGCASSVQTPATPERAQRGLELRPAVWAPKRIYAPLDALSRKSAESLLRNEVAKACGNAFESRSFVVFVPPATGLDVVPMLALEYVCTESGGRQGAAPAALER